MYIKALFLASITSFLAFWSTAETTENSYTIRASDYTERQREIDHGFIEKCNAQTEALYSSLELICLTGTINKEIGPRIVEAIGNNPEATFVVNSLGGDTLEAIKIARAIEAVDGRVIISGVCHSSCANYIAPSAHQIVVWDASVIMMHGSLPRDFVTFFNSFPDKPRTSDVNEILNSEAFHRALEVFPNHIASSVVDETVFFSEITPNEHYLHRYWEIERNIELYAKPECQAKTGFDIVVGPKYVKEFSFRNIQYFWWADKSTVLEAAEFRKRDAVIVLDLDLMPSWVPELGFVKQEECLKPFED